MALMPTPEPITLRFGYSREDVELQPLFDAFQEQNPSITIEPVEIRRWTVSGDTWLQTLEVDVFRDGRRALAFAPQGLLRRLDEVQLGDWADIRDDYYGGTWEGLAIEGQQWGVPAALDTMVCYVNMDLARALGVGVSDEGDWTLLEFAELAIQMTPPERGYQEEGSSSFGFCTAANGYDPMVFIYLHGGKIVDDINVPTRAFLDDPLTVEAIQWYSDLTNLHAVVPDPKVIQSTFRRGGIYEAQFRGACGMWLGWYGSRAGGNTSRSWSFDWRILPLPQEGAAFGLGDIEGYFITKDCAHPKEALQLLRFLSDHWEGAGKKLPPRRSLVATAGYEDSVSKEVAAVVKAFPEEMLIMPGELGEEMQRVGAVLQSAIAEIVSEDLDAVQVLAEAQRQVRYVFQSP
jgi:ABC-type glycerol-3-phosphate transport system substrate-binding protein